ncbi:single-stranded-DNA-specific exonuclease RecJ [Leptospira langatensis]|uniref:Single-stranded-DNA-specific exonuclease RecJ n=1 Tax=Leptospira langatensis TaxID=2484983 RepID=A0A5F1ZQ99_9LEPT|nr:single-stranded-DNA-specific exonuclease RecJ [Leptospira langatensis]TGK05317.1 single-stranded-DNA-specific exonuclease RecJ [Leptospira langatensis]TGL38453.1 single-stranded-DNA-specific exonuclease RecJ [Leptospira langatensis]
MPEHGPEFQKLPHSSFPGFTALQSHVFGTLFGPSTSKEILSQNLSDLPSPFLLPDMEEAVAILRSAVAEQKSILLYGDRDSDGVCSTSLLASFLRNIHQGKLTVKTSSEEDYGLCAPAMKFVRDVKPDLLVTLDFGTSNSAEIQELNQEGIQVIVLDHHEIPETIPSFCKLISPKRSDSKYPSQKICTSVLSWKLITAWLYSTLEESNILYWVPDGETFFSGTLVKKGIRLFKGDRSEAERHFPGPYTEWEKTSRGPFPEREVFYSQISKYPGILNQVLQNLDLASIGTITDMMPLTGENRILVKEGCSTLQRIKSGEYSHRPGLNRLLSQLDLNKKKVLSRDLGWSIGPALNAAGRMQKTETALSLLLSSSEKEAEGLATDLLKLNEERRERTKRNLFRVEGFLKRKRERTERAILFCYEPDFEPGVSGIVATRLVEQYKRPVIFIAPDHGHAKGSVRAYGEENVLNLLKKAEPIFHQFGGHKEAGGFSLSIDQIPKLAEILFQEASTWLEEERVAQTNQETKSLVSLLPQELREEIYEELGIFEPFGQENPAPLLSIRGAKILSYRPLSDGKHARFKILAAEDSIQCIVWNKAADFSNALRERGELDLWGYLEENTFRGKTNLQFVVDSFR